jgi:hypothetical protein
MNEIDQTVTQPQRDLGRNHKHSWRNGPVLEQRHGSRSVEALSLAMVLRENIAGLPPGSEHLADRMWFLGQSLLSELRGRA